VQQRLDRIREHLRCNLSIGKDDFEELPVFNCYGGWGKASKEFGPELPYLGPRRGLGQFRLT
jgi:hypothetical protein